MRLFRALAALLLAATLYGAPAAAQVYGARAPLLSGVRDAYPGAVLALDFVGAATAGIPSCKANGVITSNCAAVLSTTRASVGYGACNGQLILFQVNQPRITCQGLLTEAAKTNLLLWSQDPTNAAWTKSGGQTVVANAVIAPDGTLTGASDTSTSADPQLFQQVTASASTSYTGCVWLRTPSGTLATKIQLGDQIGGTLGVAASITLTTAWQRFCTTQTTLAGTTGVRLAIGGFGTLPSTTVFDVWQGQIEQAGYGSSDIPTTSAAATRAADNITVLVNGWSGTAGTIFADISFESSTPPSATNQNLWGADTSTPIDIDRFDSGIVLAFRGAGVTGDTGLSVPGAARVATAFAVGDFAVSVNGAAPFTASSLTTLGAATKLGVGDRANGTQQLDGYVRRLIYQTGRASNSALQSWQ